MAIEIALPYVGLSYSAFWFIIGFGALVNWRRLSRMTRDESMRVNAEFSAIETDPGD